MSTQGNPIFSLFTPFKPLFYRAYMIHKLPVVTDRRIKGSSHSYDNLMTQWWWVSKIDAERSFNSLHLLCLCLCREISKTLGENYLAAIKTIENHCKIYYHATSIWQVSATDVKLSTKRCQLLDSNTIHPTWMSSWLIKLFWLLRPIWRLLLIVPTSFNVNIFIIVFYVPWW